MTIETQVKEHPILFSGEMVRAILDGRKTQTRRVVKPQTDFTEAYEFTGGDRLCSIELKEGIVYLYHCEYPEEWSVQFKCPYGVPGDRLWVRETWYPYTGHGCYVKGVKVTEGSCNIGYKADMKDSFDATYRPSIHMPRWASRITLEVTSVRVERVQDISEEDAKAEGVDCVYSMEFAKLWDSINEKRGYGWDKNPWVWVIEFKAVDPCLTK